MINFTTRSIPHKTYLRSANMTLMKSLVSLISIRMHKTTHHYSFCNFNDDDEANIHKLVQSVPTICNNSLFFASLMIQFFVCGDLIRFFFYGIFWKHFFCAFLDTFVRAPYIRNIRIFMFESNNNIGPVFMLKKDLVELS